VKLLVQTYAGYKGDERPVRFSLDDREYLVEEIVDQWYGPDDTFFKVRADDRNVYILRRRQSAEWVLEGFRREHTPESKRKGRK
jgi:hypothetical protein